MNGTGWLGRVSLAVEQMCEAEVAPAVKAQMLRELATWHRTFATRAGSPSYGSLGCLRRKIWMFKPHAWSKNGMFSGRSFGVRRFDRVNRPLWNVAPKLA